VGTLYKRNICETIKGVALFLKNNPSMNLCYDIIGFGNKEDIYELQETINNESLQGKVIFHGRKNYTELSPFFEKSNVGISYIPIVPYYDCQPATKTFEYILSGMVCIATSTYENKKLINNINGVLCNDNPESFARALEEIKENKHKYNSEAIRETLMNYTWENIIHNVMIPTLEKINSNFK
jgi:glycosyltransferase involved in cell wall biosynthesis